MNFQEEFCSLYGNTLMQLQSHITWLQKDALPTCSDLVLGKMNISPFKFLLVTTNFLFAMLPDTFENGTRKQDEDGFDCFTRGTDDFFMEVASREFQKDLYLKGFVFDEGNVKQFSDTISRLQIEKLSLVQCDMNDELASQLQIPPTLKSIQLERLNISAIGIQMIIEKLHFSVESIEISKCFGCYLSWQKVKLNLPRLTSLKQIQLSNLDEQNIDIYYLLASLAQLPLELIKLHNVLLGRDGFGAIRNQWINNKSVQFINSLKVFDLKFNGFAEYSPQQLIHYLTTFPHLEVLSFDTLWTFEQISISSLPTTIKQFELGKFKEIFMNDSDRSIYNSEFLSKFPLTHLKVSGEFEFFPFELFSLGELEHLDMLNVSFLYEIEDLIEQYSCKKLKYLAIRSPGILLFLPALFSHFPVLERLVVNWIYSDDFDPYLKKILSGKSLKSLELEYFDFHTNYLGFNELISSSVQVLKLKGINWKYATFLFDMVDFLILKEIHLSLEDDEFDLNEILERLSHFFHLTSITLSGEHCQQLDECSSFLFKNLQIFELNCALSSLNLDNFLCGMPNLIELHLRLSGQQHELNLQKPIQIRYLCFYIEPNNFDSNSLVNFVKNMPKLIQMESFIARNWIIEGEILATDLAYYLQELREYFEDELQFEITFNSWPILLLRTDAELLEIIRYKSPKLSAYLNDKFPMSQCEGITKLLFTIEIDKVFYKGLLKEFSYLPIYWLINRFGMDKCSSDDFIIMQVFFVCQEATTKTTSIDSSRSIQEAFYEHLVKNLIEEVDFYFQDECKKFIQKYYEINRHFGFAESHSFLKCFFNSLAKSDDYGGNNLFGLFSSCILVGSFAELINKIKDQQLNEQELNALVTIRSFKYYTLSAQLKTIGLKEYEQMVIQFSNSFLKLKDRIDFFGEFFFILNEFSSSKPECPVCLDLLYKKELKFFESAEKDFRHLFHSECLDDWIKLNNSCPVCRSEPKSVKC